MQSLARFCFRRRWLVLVTWLVIAVAAVVISTGVGSNYNSSFTLPGTQTQKALDLLKADFPTVSGDSDSIVLHATTGRITDASAQQAAETMLARVAKDPAVRTVISPFTAATAGSQIAKDGTIAYATVIFDAQANVLPHGDIKRVIKDAQSARSSTLQVELGGQAIETVEFSGASASEGAGVVVAAIILFLAFGSWRGMVTPLITAILSILIGTSLISLVSQVTPIVNFATELAVLIGLGVGVDYALFIVSRHRSGLLRGLDPEDAVTTALNTSGRAVLFAGATVCVALLGLLLLGVSFLRGVAIGAAVTVALTMLASVTLTPALLGFWGMKVLGRRGLRQLSANGPQPEHAQGFWLRWARLVERRRWLMAGGALVVIVIIALPFFSIRLGASDAGNDPKSQTSRQAYDLLARGFGPGFNGPLQVSVSLDTPNDAAAVETISRAVGATAGVAAVGPARFSPNGRTAVFNAVPTSSPQDKATATLVHTLRDDVVPPALRGLPVKAAYVGGSTAAFIDFAHVIGAKLPVFIGVVVLVAFLLLLVAFRSLLVPLVASLMNLLAAGAAFGVLVFIFQMGHLGSLFAVERAGPIQSFVPVLLFAILFGLSMDYQVFLVSRMHEEWLRTGRNHEAVTAGQAETGRVVTAAALIMIGVFTAFVFSGNLVLAEFGLGLAAAVLLDAFILRTILVPSLMHLIGPNNWAFPGWLDRVVPHISIEPADDEEPPRADVVPAAAD